VSSAPPVPGTTNGVGPWWKLWLFVNENPGDQVIAEPMFTGDGVRLTEGNVCEMRPLPISWLRLPPMFSVPQSNCLMNVNAECRLAAARYGLTVFV